MKHLSFARVEKFFFLLLIFTIPFQIRVFLYSAEVFTGFYEWQSAFLYGTDIIVLILIVLAFFRSAHSRFSKVSNSKSKITNKLPTSSSKNKTVWSFFRNKLQITSYLLLITLFFAFLSVFFADYFGVGAYRFLKILEGAFLFLYTATMLKRLSLSRVLFVLGISGVFQALVGIGQFLKQGSLGLNLLGEVPLVGDTRATAEIVTHGGRFIRSYGTFPSPNVFAAFLAIAVFALLVWYLFVRDEQKGIKFDSRYVVSVVGIVIMLFALVLTFSRMGIGAFLVAAILFSSILIFSKDLRPYRKKFFTLVAPVFLFVVPLLFVLAPEIYDRFFTTSFVYNDPAIQGRFFLNQLSLDIFKAKPFGVGVGNLPLAMTEFFPGLRDALYQPTHNIFLLNLVELGVIGGSLFILFFASLAFNTLRNFFQSKSIIGLLLISLLLFIFITSLFDHYFITLQQGALTFWIILGIVFSHVRDENTKRVRPASSS